MWRKALIAVVAIALFTVGLGVIVYVSVARDRLVPTPPAPAATATRPAAESTPLPPTAAVAAVGVVREYSPGALIIVMTPVEGNVEQIIVLPEVVVTHEGGQPARPEDIRPGQTLFAEGELDALGRLLATRITIVAAEPTATPTASPSPSPTVEPSATPTGTPMAGWEGEYFANTEVRGAPAATREDEAIQFSWGGGVPLEGLPADLFSVRWTSRREFEAATYRFYAQADDGVRIYIDGQQVLDGWRDHSGDLLYADVTLSAGLHHVRVDYWEGGGNAAVAVWWDRPDLYPDWKGEYFANTNLQGAPALTRNDAEIRFDWGDAAPAPELPADGFSVRWTRDLATPEGPYQVIVTADDGARVWVDELLLIDGWGEGVRGKQVGHVYLTEGQHRVRIEYYEGAGAAGIQLWWQRLETFTYWRGEYYANPDLAGVPAFVRDDQAIDFDWGLGAPGPGLPADNYSVRWRRTLSLERGRYEFWAEADDGVRIIVDGRIVVDEWRDSGMARYSGATTLEAGLHEIIVEYYERGEQALVRMGWDTVAPTPTLEPTEEPRPTAPTNTSGRKPPKPPWKRR